MNRREFVKTIAAISVGAVASKNNRSKASAENKTMIDIWYGDEQRFGHLGLPQRWINVLGRVDPRRVVDLQYTLDDAAPQPLSIGPDGHRLAAPGDFNLELAFDALTTGRHTLAIIATDSDGNSVQHNVTLVMEERKRCPLPHRIQWNQVSRIQDAAQIVDGRWELTARGVRVVEPYYDRVIALGDLSWTDYEIRTIVTFHGLRVPNKEQGDAGANVIHAALAVRWPGHDMDERQPHVKWYPLGATAEFRVNPSWKGCSWRILGGGGIVAEETEKRAIELEQPYAMKHRVESTRDSAARYRVKLWETGMPEPEDWDVELLKEPSDVHQGGALLIAHYSAVTFGDLEVLPV
ncbi:hypothetical protein ACFL6S_19555 [Candidatus Poribacteria bacterium]